MDRNFAWSVVPYQIFGIILYPWIFHCHAVFQPQETVQFKVFLLISGNGLDNHGTKPFMAIYSWVACNISFE